MKIWLVLKRNNWLTFLAFISSWKIVLWYGILCTFLADSCTSRQILYKSGLFILHDSLIFRNVPSFNCKSHNYPLNFKVHFTNVLFFNRIINRFEGSEWICPLKTDCIHTYVRYVVGIFEGIVERKFLEELRFSKRHFDRC